MIGRRQLAAITAVALTLAGLVLLRTALIRHHVQRATHLHGQFLRNVEDWHRTIYPGILLQHVKRLGQLGYVRTLDVDVRGLWTPDKRILDIDRLAVAGLKADPLFQVEFFDSSGRTSPALELTQVAWIRIWGRPEEIRTWTRYFQDRPPTASLLPPSRRGSAR